MSTPTLYIKHGCPYCEAAVDYLEQQQIDCEQVDVRGDDEKMEKLKEVSGQARTPTLDWHGKVLANFDVDELKIFLAEQGTRPADAIS